MEKLSFFTPITYGQQSKMWTESLLEKVDGAFLGKRQAYVIQGHAQGKSRGVKCVHRSSSLLTTVCKVVFLYCTVIPILTLLVAKFILRTTHHFYVIAEPPVKQNLSPTLSVAVAEKEKSEKVVSLPQVIEKQEETLVKIQNVYQDFQVPQVVKEQEVPEQNVLQPEVSLHLESKQQIAHSIVSFSPEIEAFPIEVSKQMKEEDQVENSLKESIPDLSKQPSCLQKILETYETQTTIKCKLDFLNVSDSEGIQEKESHLSAENQKEAGIVQAVESILDTPPLDQSFESVHLKPLVVYQEKAGDVQFEILEMEKKLVIFERTKEQYVKVEQNLKDFLLEISQKSFHPQDDGISIAAILLHPYFNSRRNAFIKVALASDPSGAPLLFGFTNHAAIDVLNAATVAQIKVDPAQLIDKNKRNLFDRALDLEESRTLLLFTYLIKHYSKSFQSVAQAVIAKFLNQRNTQAKALAVKQVLKECRIFLNDYHTVWLSIASGEKLTFAMKKKMQDLTDQGRAIMYETAYQYNNIFVYESSEKLIKKNLYTLNFRYSHLTESANDEQFLCKNQTTFNEKFKNIKEWAKEHPTTVINIWVDSTRIDPKIIENSKPFLQKMLEGLDPDRVKFRDMRSLKIVVTNPHIFNHIPNLSDERYAAFMKANISNDVLGKKEGVYAVSADLNVKALSRQQLFEKRTRDFLRKDRFVLAMGEGKREFETSFHILSAKKYEFMGHHALKILDCGLENLNKENLNAIIEAQYLHLVSSTEKKVSLPRKPIMIT